MHKLAAAAAALVALAVPSLARGGLVAMRVQEIPLGLRALAAVPAPMHFNMLAVHWQGPGRLLYRVHRLHGRWIGWRAVDDDVSPDGGTGPWHDGNLDWTGGSDGIQLRARGEVRHLRAYELWSRVTVVPRRRLSEAGSPTIVTRAGWGADERIVRAKPLIARTLKLAIVHHTAGTNAYTPAQAAAIVRGIEVYHVKGNGWNDIGYNFLVDRYGTVYEGRGGGIDKNVIGAHSEGFNAGTVGVSLIGNYSTATPPVAQRDALVSLLAWRLDVAHIDPLSTVVYTSGGNLKFRAGKLVTLRAISGHRDTGPTECPGSAAYRLLPAIAKRVAATGLPKIYAPTVSGVLGGSIRFQARLSAALPWTVTVTDALGRVAAQGSGDGVLVDWTWSSLVGGKGFYTWTIATPGALAASGTLGVGRPASPPSLTGLTEAPGVITPAADGSGGQATVSFKLGAASVVRAQLLDATGASLSTVLAEHRLSGVNRFVWDAGALPDGRYTLSVTATPESGGRSITKSIPVVVDRTLTGLTVTPAALSPNGDGVDDTTTISFTLTQSVPVRVDVEQDGAVLATPWTGTLPVGPQAVPWDGTSGDGLALPDGTYEVVVTVTDELGDVQLVVPVTVDTTPPVLTIVDPHALTFSLDEPATVTVLVNERIRIVKGEPRGTFTIPFTGGVYQLWAEAQDAAGNLSPVVTA